MKQEKMTIITDCTGVKHDAIKGVFDYTFKDTVISPSAGIEIVKKGNFGTPLNFFDFSIIARKRMEEIVNVSKEREAWYATIQRGYYQNNGIWHLSALACVISPVTGTLTEAMTSSVPIPEKASNQKMENPLLNFGDIFAAKFPEWDREKESVYTLLTGDDEKMWLQQPLRYCMKYLLR